MLLEGRDAGPAFAGGAALDVGSMSLQRDYDHVTMWSGRIGAATQGLCLQLMIMLRQFLSCTLDSCLKKHSMPKISKSLKEIRVVPPANRLEMLLIQDQHARVAAGKAILQNATSINALRWRQPHARHRHVLVLSVQYKQRVGNPTASWLRTQNLPATPSMKDLKVAYGIAGVGARRPAPKVRLMLPDGGLAELAAALASAAPGDIFDLGGATFAGPLPGATAMRITMAEVTLRNGALRAHRRSSSGRPQLSPLHFHCSPWRVIGSLVSNMLLRVTQMTGICPG
jgi:hypothetical protein